MTERIGRGELKRQGKIVAALKIAGVLDKDATWDTFEKDLDRELVLLKLLRQGLDLGKSDAFVSYVASTTESTAMALVAAQLFDAMTQSSTYARMGSLLEQHRLPLIVNKN